MEGKKALLYFSDNQDAVEITESAYQAVESAVSAVMDSEEIKIPCEVSVSFVGDAEIRGLNLQYRQRDTATDVLSFPFLEPERACKLKEDGAEEYFKGDINRETGAAAIGDVIISMETAARQAKSLNQSFIREIQFLTVHSTLHLLGYDHEKSADDEAIMFQRQKEIMDTLD